MLVSGIILALYFWVFFSGTPVISEVLFVDDWAAMMAGVSFVVAAVSYLWSPKKHLFEASFFSYTLLMATIVTLIMNTGYLSSPFIAIWMIAVVFSPVFGWYGIGLILGMLAGFLGWYWYQEVLDSTMVIVATLVTAAPMLVGILSWRPGTDEEDEPEYLNGATTKNTVSGKSEVVIAAIADGVLALDKKGMIQLINPAAQKLIGWGKNDAVGLDYKSVLKMVDNRDKDVEGPNDPVRQALETNHLVSTENYSLLTADTNKKFLASITASPVGSMGSGIIVVFRDITSEKAEEREQAEFISTASHEMRTPVASIEGYLGLALNPQTAQIDDKAREYIGKAQEAAKHLGRLFQDLLDVSRADDGRLSNNPRIVDVVPFLGDIVLGLMPKATEKGLQVSYKPDPDLAQHNSDQPERGDRVISQVLYVNVDNDHLREVLANLVENAIKYTLAGSVTIDAQGDDQHVTISISDSGIGIPKEDIPHLFQKFYRVDNTETREIGGTGLGLYLSRKLTEAMGGKIWAESIYQQGSTFYVRFPRVDHVEAKRLIEQPTVQTTTPQNQPQPQAIPQPTSQPAPQIQTISAIPIPQPVTQTIPVQAAPPQAAPMPPVRPQLNPNGSERPSVESMGPPPRPNQAPLFIPNTRENTPLSSIEQNPHQYIQNPQSPPNTPPPPQ